MGLMDIFNISKIKEENIELKKQINELSIKMTALGVTEYYQTKEKLDLINNDIVDNNNIVAKLREEIQTLTLQNEKLKKSVNTQTNKITKCKEIYKSIDYAISNFFNTDTDFANCKISTIDFDELELISPSVILKLHCMDVKSLKKAFRDNENAIDKILEQYSSRYTTKANKSIYSLMVIALRAELQNILYNLKYEKLDKSI